MDFTYQKEVLRVLPLFRLLTTSGLKCSTDGKYWKPDFTNGKECCRKFGLQAHPDPTIWPVYHFGSGTCSGGMQKTEQEWIDWAAGNSVQWAMLG